MIQRPRTVPRRRLPVAPGVALSAALGIALAFHADPLHAQPAVPGSNAPVTVAPQNLPAQKSVTVLGLGLMSCSVYGALQQVGAGDIANQWLLGFLSGGGAFAGSNYLGSTSLIDAIKLVQQYCTANPKTSLVAAGLEVAQELEGPVGQMRPK